jgi:hypothetical protein
MSMLIDPVVSTYCDRACATARVVTSRRTRVLRGWAHCSYGADSGDNSGASREAAPPDARFNPAEGFRICLSRSRATTGEV